MIIKSCPFCSNESTYTFDSKRKIYSLECQHCKQKGLTIRIENENLEDLINIWNTRVFEDFLLQNPEKSINLLSLLNGTLKDPAIIKDTVAGFAFGNILNYQNDIYGYLIDKSGKLHICDKSHVEMICECLDLDVSILNVDQTSLDEIINKYLLEMGFIKISAQANCMFFNMSYKKVNKKQIDAIYKFILDKNPKDIKVFCVFLNIEETDVKTFTNQNDLLMFLDSI